jgi:putative drug exporter of the RND superfamily
VKLFGLGLASAVLVDAVIIRSILVPAIMQLFGKNAWWMPAWLSRILPNLAVEPAGSHGPAKPAAAED